MKIGILTFHCAHNYGAVLQCFGLQVFLKSLGHEVFVIDYRPQYLIDAYKKHSRRDWICVNPKITLNKILNEPRFFASRARRHDNFDQFINTKFNLFPYTQGMDYHDFDAIILGSDQIWEAPITGGKFDDVFFGVGAKCKVISYAASNKSIQLTEEEIRYYQKHLSNFSGIGVREVNLQKLLSQVIDKPVSLNVDPTLLAGRLLKDNIEDKRLYEGRYILVYEIIEHKDVIAKAREYAKAINAKVIMLSAYIYYTDSDIRDQEASPADFVNYIRHAECVFTTSFHGTAISILCGTQFYCFRQNNSSDMRIESLLSILGISERFIESSDILREKKIDYNKVNSALEKAVKYSEQFIQTSLS